MRRLLLLFPTLIPLLALDAAAATFTTEKTDRGVTVKVDGQLFTEYLIRSGVKPILWPIIGPTGKPMTRPWPMEPANTQGIKKPDHPHQRSLWFDHGNVNGVNFWEESSKAGSIRHREFVEVRGGDDARIVTRNDWITPGDKKLCEDERTFTFRSDADRRIIDFAVTVTASEGPTIFADEKDAGFGIRVPNSMAVDAKQGGRIINSEGQTDAAAWAQPASWVDYHGPVDGEELGIAILNHPSSLRYPNRWHVRTYGLFAANPFGKKSLDATSGSGGPVSLQRGQTFSLRYRVILHRGDEKSSHIAEAFAAYAKEEFPIKQEVQKEDSRK